MILFGPCVAHQITYSSEQIPLLVLPRDITDLHLRQCSRFSGSEPTIVCLTSYTDMWLEIILI